MMNEGFKSFEISESGLRAVEALGFKTPTPIQSKVIPLVLEGKDLIGCAQTGTGKTLAYCLPIFEKLLRENKGGLAVVLVPTREIALQVYEVWRFFSRFSSGLNSAVIIGGKPMKAQEKALKGGNLALVLATPGRLLDHINRGNLNLMKTSVLVLDEADRMLDMGFEPTIKRILQTMKRERQTLMFSATWNSEIHQVSKKYQSKGAVLLSVGSFSRAASTVEQRLLHIDASKKNDLLLDEIKSRLGSILVFTRTKRRTDRLYNLLNSYNLSVQRIHGDRSQGQRNSALNAFRTGKTRVLIATDIAARGIDVLEIGHVINYDLPQLPEDYIHRIGRTGRAGQVGKALSFVTPEDRADWREIEKLLKKSGSALPVSA